MFMEDRAGLVEEVSYTEAEVETKREEQEEGQNPVIVVTSAKTLHVTRETRSRGGCYRCWQARRELQQEEAGFISFFFVFYGGFLFFSSDGWVK